MNTLSDKLTWLHNQEERTFRRQLNLFIAEKKINAVRINSIKAKIADMEQNSTCRLYDLHFTSR